MKLIECQIKRKTIIINKIYTEKPKIGDWFPPHSHLITYHQLLKMYLNENYKIKYGYFIDKDDQMFDIFKNK